MAESSTITQKVADLIELSVSVPLLAAQGHQDHVRAAIRGACNRYAEMLQSPADMQSLALFMASITRVAGDEGFEDRAKEYLDAALMAAKKSA